MAGNGFTVDLSKPTVFQVGYLGDTYHEWVYTPIRTTTGTGSLRFFKSDLLEILTRTVWWVVPVIWVPLAFWFISISYTMDHRLPQVILMSVLGSFVWALVEISYRSFLTYINTKSYWGNTIHYLIHGRHHKNPKDRLRLVMPPTGTTILALLFWNLYGALFSLPTRSALFGGGLIGHVMFNLFHYYLHHGQPITQAIKSIKKSHLIKHFGKGFAEAAEKSE